MLCAPVAHFLRLQGGRVGGNLLGRYTLGTIEVGAWHLWQE